MPFSGFPGFWLSTTIVTILDPDDTEKPFGDLIPATDPKLQAVIYRVWEGK